MQAVVFGDCAGWLHPAPGLHGVVLCNAFGYDELCTHRAWLQLAEQLAAQRMPVLRFDYSGTGNSLGVEEDPARIDAWIDNIAAAVGYLRAVSGVQRVSLCGFRLGATLAALAAERLADVDGLVLLAPVLSGRKYLRELHAHQQRWLSARNGLYVTTVAEGSSAAGAYGFGLHGADIERLAAVDLRTDTTAPARRVLLLDANDRAGIQTLADQYRQHGVAVQREPFAELDRFLVEARLSKLPVHAFAAVSAWLVRGAEADRHAQGAAGREALPDVHRRATLAVPELAAQNFVEQPVCIGQCFGVYCRARTPRANAPVVLFPNTAANHNIGDGRYFVLFARHLASLGISSLRMDLGGLGDSAPTDTTVTVTQDSLHSAQACADVVSGANWLVARGHSAVVTFGICSGAYVGLHACAAHPRIIGSFGVNLQQFVWEGEARTRGEGALASNRTLRRSALSIEKWKRVLTGEASLAHTARGLSKRATRRLQRRVHDLLNATVGWSFSPNGTRQLLERLQQKGADVRLLYGEFDHGIDELKLQFGTTLRGLRRFPHVRVAMLPILDHSLFTRPAREAAMTDAQQWLLERFCGLPDPVEATHVLRAAMTPAPAADT